MSWRNLCGVICALCTATLATAQDSVVSPVMQTQVRSAPTPAATYYGVMTEDETEDTEIMDDGQVDPAAWLQQGTRQPSLATNQPSARAAAAGQRLARSGLVSAPNMFGDLPMSTAMIETINTAGGAFSFKSNFTVPLVGASRIGKISENDSPIPRDRFFFNYNHFQNVFQLSETPLAPPGPPIVRQQSIDRYVIGGEKTFFDGWTSIELRMPLLGTIDAQLQSFGLNAAGWGNLTAVFKTLLYMDDSTAIGAGMSVETPTGSSLFTRIGAGTTQGNLQFVNQSTHLAPYIGFVWSPGDPRWGWGNGLFLTGFAQIDTPTASNTVNVVNPDRTIAGAPLGKLTDQTLGFLDLGGGYWVYRDPFAERWTGLAVVGELHYTTSMTNADRIAGTVAGNPIILNATDPRFDVLNGTIGLQALMFDASSFRVAGVFPLGNENRRLFDSEIQFQFNRRF